MRDSGIHAASRFLLVYRAPEGANVIIIEAASLAAAQAKAMKAGLVAPNSFRLGQQLDAEFVALLRPEHVGRVLCSAEAKDLLALFEAHSSGATKVSPAVVV
jgi:hypothetical protein